MHDGYDTAEAGQGHVGASAGSTPRLTLDKQEESRRWEAQVHATDRAKRDIVNQAMQGGAVSNVAHSSHYPQPPSLDNIEDMMRYQPWAHDQQQAGDIVREALTAAAKAILRVVPNSAHRDAAVQYILNARMHANAAISFRGRF